MTENNPNTPGGEKPREPDGPFTQQFAHNPVTARVPDRVARGVLSTGAVVLDSPNEFILDFLQGLARPHQIVARVVLTPTVMSQFINAAQTNLGNYVNNFGPPPPLPKPPPGFRPPSIQEIYENFKIPDELLSGSYANSVMIGHSATDFCFDFITGFYPTSAVSARVFVPAQQMPRMIDTLNNAMQQFRRRTAGPAGQPPPASPPPAPPAATE